MTLVDSVCRFKMNSGSLLSHNTSYVKSLDKTSVHNFPCGLLYVNSTFMAVCKRCSACYISCCHAVSRQTSLSISSSCPRYLYHCGPVVLFPHFVYNMLCLLIWLNTFDCVALTFIVILPVSVLVIFSVHGVCCVICW